MRNKPAPALPETGYPRRTGTMPIHIRRGSMLKSILTAVFMSSIGFCAAAERFDPSILKEGDIIFHESMTDQARALKLATKSRYTHVAILFRNGNEWYVEEAVQPVKYTRLSDFIGRGKNSHYAVKRIRNSSSLLTSKKINELKTYGRSFLGKNYDLTFEWSDRKIYCTELVWKLYKKVLNVEVGRLEHLGDFDLSDPFVKRIMKDRYGSRIPYDELVISPKAMFESDVLETVVVNNQQSF